MMMIECNSLEVEQSILGGFFLWGEELREKVGIVEQSDFANERLGDIFQRVKDKIQNTPTTIKIDNILLLSLISPDERAVVVECMQVIVSIHSFDQYISRLKELARKRRLRSRVTTLTCGDFGLSDLKKIVEDEEQNHSYENSKEKSKMGIDDFVSNINEPQPTIMTGFNSLDRTTGGIKQGTLFYLGARPSTGKTTLAINIAMNQRKFNARTVIFSLEMSSGMIYERIAAAECDIPYAKFSKRTLSEVEKGQAIQLAEQIKQEEQLFVLDDVYSVESICNTISELKPDLAIVDFIQIVTTSKKFIDTRSTINYISSEFKRVAKNTGCVILILSQLSRNGKDAPTMSDLKESGSLEQDGDYIALLHRPYVLDKKNPDIQPERTEFIMDKNKFGGNGVIPMRFDLKYQKFYEIDERHLEGLPFE
jgi:replicative DNA helicase